MISLRPPMTTSIGWLAAGARRRAGAVLALRTGRRAAALGVVARGAATAAAVTAWSVGLRSDR
jgi:hypothetical protein